jgi:hypothetical protein
VFEDLSMDELLDEIAAGGGLTLKAAALRLTPAAAARPVHPFTVREWVTDGVTRPDGRVVKLAAVKVGKRWVTSERCLREFIKQQQRG